MGNLYIGTDVISIKDAVKQLQKNIDELESKKIQINLQGHARTKILGIYEKKISSQQAILSWLRRVLQQN